MASEVSPRRAGPAALDGAGARTGFSERPGGARVAPVSAKSAPAAIGPYVQGVSVATGSRFVFTSGQLPLDPSSGELVGGGIAAEARRALQNALAIVEEAGGGRKDVVRSTIYLVEMASYPAVNEVYEGVFADHFPARTVIGVSALPRGASLEVELVAAVPG